MKKIAILGTAPSSVHLAPFKDLSYQIWACSPGNYPVLARERCDVFFELHRFESPVIGLGHLQVPWFTPEYVAWLRQFKGTIYTGEQVLELPTSVRLPREHLQEVFGPYFFTSSIAWMAALALETNPDLEELGFFGVDMSAKEEYIEQRQGCHYFITEAVKRGIKITVPPESDLLQAPMQYAIDEWMPMMIKITARRKELEGRRAAAQQAINNANNELWFVSGALDDIDYFHRTWVSNAGLEKLANSTSPAETLRQEINTSLKNAVQSGGQIERVVATDFDKKFEHVTVIADGSGAVQVVKDEPLA